MQPGGSHRYRCYRPVEDISFCREDLRCGPRKAENGEGIHLPEFCNQPVSAILVVVKLHKTTDAKHIGRTHGIRFPVPCIQQDIDGFDIQLRAKPDKFSISGRNAADPTLARPSSNER